MRAEHEVEVLEEVEGAGCEDGLVLREMWIDVQLQRGDIEGDRGQKGEGEVLGYAVDEGGDGAGGDDG